VCGIFQYSSLFAVEYIIGLSCFSMHSELENFYGICIVI
jgi:hypothetical protein